MSRSPRFWNLISRREAELCHLLVLNINTKAYTESPMTLSYLNLSDLERLISRSLKFQRLLSCKATEAIHVLLLNINRKSHMWSPILPSHLTLSDFERSKFRCRKWSKIDTCLARYCVRVKPIGFNWFTSLQKIAIVIPTAAVKQSAKVYGPLVCWFYSDALTMDKHIKYYISHLSKTSIHQLKTISGFLS